jgi:hypothetical protein
VLVDQKDAMLAVLMVDYSVELMAVLLVAQKVASLVVQSVV